MGDTEDLGELYRPAHPLRVLTAASLFDGHDAAINIMRRLLQAQGAEVIHLGHNRSVDEVVDAAVCEDVSAIALSSYQGGHLEYFTYLIDRLREVGRGDVRVFGGGGGVIIPEEIAQLEAYGVTKVYSPADGQRLGLERMINEIVRAGDVDVARQPRPSIEDLVTGDPRALARIISLIELGALDESEAAAIAHGARAHHAPVLGITGTGGAGKSSLCDELLLRFRFDLGEKLRVAVIAVDPSKRRGGGALLGDRIRMNSLEGSSIYFRSLATRASANEVPAPVPEIIDACRAARYDLIIVETPGIGQGDAAVVDVSDLSLYVMTPEFGAATQLEKIEMIDLADAVAINKFDRRGADDALRSVTRQWRRSHPGHGAAPVFPTVASHFHDRGTTTLYLWLREQLIARGLAPYETRVAGAEAESAAPPTALVPPRRARYLAEIADAVRDYHRTSDEQTERLRAWDHVAAARAMLDESAPEVLVALEESCSRALDPITLTLVEDYEARRRELLDPTDDTTRVRSLSGTEMPRVALPRGRDRADLYAWLRRENLPGSFPFTAGVFARKRRNEDPARMFAGEGDPARTNRRFHLLSENQPATRLSTAFDSVTLYGRDPDTAPDIYGKVGTSGVSVATLEDMADLYAGFDLCDPATSVSMTINGPAPTVLAMFFNVAIDQQIARFTANQARPPTPAETAEIRARTLATVRGTVQADILKEDQGQNTCIFSTEFSLRVMGDIQEYFVTHDVKNFYSVSISGYHIAEAGANPLTQLAFTLANGFTYVESYLARGMKIDDFAGNLSFFFSNGMDPEYTVIGRVARRIWAIALRERYGANDKSQRLKYHVQTSGRSLHAQEMAYNDVRTTLQALCAIYDNANSLHTNAFDEAVTTPSDESVRRALAIQLIINQEWGLAMNENPLQGSFVVEELTDLVEAAVLAELERINERGGVLGAMESGYQRGRIQDDSMIYEHAKHTGELPIVGVNTFTRPDAEASIGDLALARATDEEKRSQLRRLEAFHLAHRNDTDAALDRLRHVAITGGNVFAELMETVRHASLGQITRALFEVGGQYRRNV